MIYSWFKIQIRRDRPVKPEAEQVDGKVYRFREGWIENEDESYPGEFTWIVDDPTYPKDAPIWIAEGDLQMEDKT